MKCLCGWATTGCTGRRRRRCRALAAYCYCGPNANSSWAGSASAHCRSSRPACSTKSPCTSSCSYLCLCGMCANWCGSDCWPSACCGYTWTCPAPRAWTPRRSTTSSPSQSLSICCGTRSAPRNRCGRDRWGTHDRVRFVDGGCDKEDMKYL